MNPHRMATVVNNVPAALNRRPALVFKGVRSYYRWEVASESEPGKVHAVGVAVDGSQPACTCRGFLNHGHCWHTDKAIQEVRAWRD